MFFFDSCNFLFYFFFQLYFILYTHLINYTAFKILMRNDKNHVIQVLKYYKFDYITKLLYKNSFMILVSHKTASSPLMSSFLFYKHTGITILSTKTSLETELLNNIKIYGNKNIVRKIMHLIKKYSSI